MRLFIIAIGITAWLASAVAYVEASDRCWSYAQEVRRAHAHYFGVDFPWWYSVAQLQKESGCRDVISKDGVGSEGAAQITYRLWAQQLANAGIPEVRTRTNHLRAQAFINHDAWKKAKKHGRLWVAYQIYNGGTLVLKEIERAGVADHAAAREQCRRRNITFTNGQTISACDINYDYSVRIERYAETYRLGPDPPHYPFW